MKKCVRLFAWLFDRNTSRGRFLASVAAMIPSLLLIAPPLYVVARQVALQHARQRIVETDKQLMARAIGQDGPFISMTDQNNQEPIRFGEKSPRPPVCGEINFAVDKSTLWILDHEGVIRFVSTNVTSKLGVLPDDLIGQLFTSRLSDPNVANSVDDCVRASASVYLELPRVLLKKDCGGHVQAAYLRLERLRSLKTHQDYHVVSTQWDPDDRSGPQNPVELMRLVAEISR